MEGGRGQLFAGHGDGMRSKARGRPTGVLQHAGNPNGNHLHRASTRRCLGLLNSD